MAEWGLVDERYIPVFALSAQIGNENYKDFKGKVLSEDKTYMLIDKQFTPVILDDGLMLIEEHSKTKDDVEIIKCRKNGSEDMVYCVRRNGLSSHGETLRQAMSDLAFKEMESKDVSEIVENIKKCGYVTREDYRCITRACSFGTEDFAKEHGYTEVDKVELNDMISKLDDKYFGAKEFKRLFE